MAKSINSGSIRAESEIFFKVDWNWTRLELRFVIRIQTGLGFVLFKKKLKI